MQPFDPKNPNTVPTKIGSKTVVDVDISLFSGLVGKDLIRVSVSGRKGNIGRSGLDRSGSASSGYGSGASGASGADGGYGGEGEFGQDAGKISCKLDIGRNPIQLRGGLVYDSQILVSAKMQLPDGRIENNEVEIPIGIDGDISLLARGGDGGTGGRGGRGQDGGRGARGRNATRYSSGGRGGNGGRGGRGGGGGRGGNGANGGDISCLVPAKYSHLLLLVESDFQRGVGGQGGSGGPGGSGGAGGAGGSSYSWTEKRGDQTIHRSNPGGSRGSSGSSGSYGINGPKGSAGIDGSIAYITLDNQDQPNTKAQHRFAVQIMGYELKDAFEDEIYEFGEYIYVNNLQVKNIGAMDLPPERHVYLLLENSKWLNSEPLALEVPKGLAIGETHTFTEELAIRIKRPEEPLRFEKPFEAFDTLNPIAIMGGILKRFENAKRVTDLHFKHPAIISQIKGHHSIARGEASLLSWTIENIGTKELGKAGVLERLLESLLIAYHSAIEDQIPLGHIFFFDANGKALNTETGVLNSIESLQPGKENQIELSCFIGIHPDAEPMQTRMARTELKLAHPDFPSQPEIIQAPRFQIRVAKTYVKSEGSDILLVINKDTALQTVQEILAYYEKIGSKVDVWDISHYGRLDLETKSAEGKTLLQDFEGKTILIINNGFQSNQSTNIYSSDLMEKREFLRAANEFGITVYIMGKTQNGANNIAEQFGMPSNVPELSSTYQSVEAFWEAQENKASDAIDAEGGVIEVPLGDLAVPVDNYSNRESKIPLTKTIWAWQEPALKYTVNASQKIADKLQQISPRETYYGIYSHFPKLIKKSWLGLRKRYHVGDLSLRQGPHRIHGGRLLTIEANEQKLKSGEFFRSSDAATKLMLGLSIWDSMELLGDFLDANPEILNDATSRDSLMRAFMYHIAAEQAAFRQLSHRKLKKEDLEAQIIFFRSLTDFSLKFNSGRSAQALFFQHLFANTLAMLDAQHPWWNFIAPSYQNLRLTRIVRKRIDAWIERNFDTSRELKRKSKRVWEQNVTDKKAFREGMKAITQPLKKQFKAKGQNAKTRGAAALRHYIGNVRTGGGMRNRIGSQHMFDAFVKNAEKTTKELLKFEEKEANIIQDLTFTMQSNGDGFFIDKDEVKERKFVLEKEELIDNEIAPPRTELDIPDFEEVLVGA